VITVLLADDQPLVRSGLRAVIEHDPQLVVIGEADDGRSALQMTNDLRPAVVLMDIRMPGPNGIEVCAAITGNPELASVRVLIVTTFDVDDYLFDALMNGAAGFLLKTAEPEQIRGAVRAAARGNAVLDPTVTRRVIARANRADTGPGVDLAVLTDRERDVLALIGEGLSNDEIAERLYISPLTAKTHVSRILGKLAARDRTQLAITAYRAGLVR
jgi:DNA-binding NarL/FixJ family response regulator